MKSEKKFIIVGVNGLIGKNICINLLKKNINVIGIDQIFDTEILKSKNFIKVKTNLKKVKSINNKLSFLTKKDEINGIVFCHRFSSKLKNSSNNYLDIGDDNILDVEIKSSIEIINLLINKKLLSKKSKVIFLSSSNSQSISQQPFFYHASKAMTEILIKWLADRLMPLSISVNGIRPGLIENKNKLKNVNPISKKVTNTSFGNRATTVEEIVRLIEFMILDCPEHVTAEIININGGYLNADLYYNIQKIFNK